MDNIRVALEAGLAAMTTLSTAWENKTYKPVIGTPYQECALLYAQPDNATLGCDRRREVGILQVMLKYPENKGMAAIDTRAELTREHFKRGTVFTSGGVNVLINKTPYRSTLGVIDGWCVVVVSIPFTAEIH